MVEPRWRPRIGGCMTVARRVQRWVGRVLSCWGTFALLGASLAYGCGSDSAAGDDAPDSAALESELQLLIDDIVASDPSVPGVILTVEAAGFSFAGASGSFEQQGGRELKQSDLFRAASITKTFTAAAVLVLAEQGKLDLDDTIDNLLTDASRIALENGGYDPSAITVRELLSHTAGIYDYTEAEAYYEAIYSNPERVWSRAEQLQVATEEGRPLNEPGEAFHYGDTHYILAGEIIEQVSGMPLGEALRTLLRYDEFGLEDTWLETLEEPPSEDAEARIAHAYLGDEDTRGWHASWDVHGGGGLVTSTADMLRFIDALFAASDGIFDDPTTLDEMLRVPDVAQGAFFGMDGALGMGRFPLDGGGVCYAGFGFFSTVMVICPDTGLRFAATQNQSNPEQPEAILDGVLEIMTSRLM